MIAAPVALSRLPVGSSASSSRGRGRGGAGDGHALLLAARQLGRIMGQAVAQADRFQLERGPPARVVGPGQFQRHGDIFERGHGRKQVKCLEDDAERPAAQPRQRILVQAADILAGQPDPAGVGPLQPGDDRHQRAFARSRRARARRRSRPASSLRLDAFQDFGADIALAKGQADVVEVDQGLGHGGAS